jgi:hypothetical protein
VRFLLLLLPAHTPMPATIYVIFVETRRNVEWKVQKKKGARKLTILYMNYAW